MVSRRHADRPAEYRGGARRLSHPGVGVAAGRRRVLSHAHVACGPGRHGHAAPPRFLRAVSRRRHDARAAPLAYVAGISRFARGIAGGSADESSALPGPVARAMKPSPRARYPHRVTWSIFVLLLLFAILFVAGT